MNSFGASSLNKKRKGRTDYEIIQDQEQARFEKLPKEEQDKIIQAQKEQAAKDEAAAKWAGRALMIWFSLLFVGGVTVGILAATGTI